MNAQIVLNSHATYGLGSAPKIVERFEAAPANTETLSDALATERLVERFADITWKTVAPVTALSLTFAVGVLACAQFFAVHI